MTSKLVMFATALTGPRRLNPRLTVGTKPRILRGHERHHTYTACYRLRRHYHLLLV